MIENLKNDIQIDRCELLFQISPTDTIVNKDVGFTILLNKNRKYAFSEIYIRLRIRGQGGYYVMFNIYDLIITFPGYTRKYTWAQETFQTIYEELSTKSLIHNFEQYGGGYTNERDPKFPFEDDESAEYDLTPDKIETNVSNQISTSNLSQLVNETHINIQQHALNESNDINQTQSTVVTEDIIETNQHNETSADNNPDGDMEKPTNNDVILDNETQLVDETIRQKYTETSDMLDAKNGTHDDLTTEDNIKTQVNNESNAEVEKPKLNEMHGNNDIKINNESNAEIKEQISDDTHDNNETRVNIESNAEIEKQKLDETHSNNETQLNSESNEEFDDVKFDDTHGNNETVETVETQELNDTHYNKDNLIP
ncbi:hypothetical protein RF11_08363 [Thelohanellus kitauei]|uniref:Uncharacterized protein n=1 Tax=Thelohanellus kitauei TaxID=669202 RepID=A0A0C2MNV2_THEKT|nr:hypothetical protein RF11_08363 [Thelohanellus kitauei]